MTQHENEIINDYCKGMTFDGLIKKYHHKFATIRQILIDNNISIETKSQRMKSKNKKNLTPQIINEIIENYKRGRGLNNAGASYNVKSYVVKHILQEHNIPMRELSSSIVARNKLQRKYFCDETFFDTQSEDMAYILGFLAADGTVSKNSNQIKITVAQKDANLLEEIKKRLNYTGVVKYTTTNQNFDIATLEITCERYKKMLAEYNIVPNKTFTFSIPEKLDKKYWRDFIRGYFDGDGSISTAGKKAFRSQICSARKITLQQILAYLEKFYHIPATNIYTTPRAQHPLYYFQYSTNATRLLYQALYYNNCLCLQRKKAKFEELI